MQQWLYQRQMRLDIDGTQEGTPVTVEFDIHTKKVEAWCHVPICSQAVIPSGP